MAAAPTMTRLPETVPAPLGWPTVEIDPEARAEREAFEQAFHADAQATKGHKERLLAVFNRMTQLEQREAIGRLEADYGPHGGLRVPAGHEALACNLTVTQIRKSFVDAEGRTRGDNYIRKAIVELAALPGFRQKRYRLSDVCEVLSVPPHELRFEKVRLTERKNMAKPQTALEAEVLEILRGADLRDPQKQETLKRIIRAFVGE